MDYATDIFWRQPGWPRCRVCTGKINGRVVDSDWRDIETKRCTHTVIDTPLQERIDADINTALEEIAESGYQANSMEDALSEIAAPMQYEPSEQVLETYQQHWGQPGLKAFI